MGKTISESTLSRLNFLHLKGYLGELLADVYPQPPDEIHHELMLEVLNKWMPGLAKRGLKTVLDIGCGQGSALPVLAQWAEQVEGVTLTGDAHIATATGFKVWQTDMNFLPIERETFDLVYARHSLEHSVMPLISLMEWHRVSRMWLMLITPKPEFWGYGGRNHYHVMEERAIRSLLLRAGWKAVDTDHEHEMEFRWLCIKQLRRKSGDPWPPKPWDLENNADK